MTKRTCGGCTLCCTLLPVEEVEKLANQKCRFQNSKGCQVYHTGRQPISCKLWACQWLLGEDTGQRPDRSRLVVDVMVDTVRVTDPDGSHVAMPAVQVWCDPRVPDAHREPRFRAWLDGYTRKLCAVVVVRWSSAAGVVLFPPWATGLDHWLEKDSRTRAQDDPAALADAAALGIPKARPETVAAIAADYRARNPETPGGNTNTKEKM